VTKEVADGELVFTQFQNVGSKLRSKLLTSVAILENGCRRALN
jgi:hypothetical protein